MNDVWFMCAMELSNNPCVVVTNSETMNCTRVVSLKLMKATRDGVVLRNTMIIVSFKAYELIFDFDMLKNRTCKSSMPATSFNCYRRNWTPEVLMCAASVSLSNPNTDKSRTATNV